jgi:hypothetical protein
MKYFILFAMMFSFGCSSTPAPEPKSPDNFRSDFGYNDPPPGSQEFVIIFNDNETAEYSDIPQSYATPKRNRPLGTKKK